jgi:glycine betaine/choline ABC-type transport system substrate-binding protein
LKLSVLADDARYFPPYEAVPIVRPECLQRHPDIGSLLANLNGKIHEEDMRSLNYAVDGEKKDGEGAVREYLEKKRFFGEGKR